MKKKSTHKFIFLSLLFLFQMNICLAQKFEVEDATLSGGATKETCSTCSGGAYVNLANGNLSLSINMAEEGYYDITINAAAPSGDKTNVFSLNGTSGDFTFKKNNQYSSSKIVGAYKLAAGEHEVEIRSSWGYINVDYIQFTKVEASQRFNLVQELIAPEPIPEAKAMFDFLLDNYGDKIISGVMTLNSMDMVNWLKENTGKEPALLGIDFMHSGRGYTWYNDEEPIRDAKTWYARNGIPSLMWHWRDPLRVTEEFYSEGTNFDVSRISDENSDEYQAILADIDYISGLLKKLQEDNVPVIWRPLHEAAGGWFWWGAKGPTPLKELWILMYDRMVNQHGLNNLIWVWTIEPGDEDWYPGDEYVDIVGRDIYKEGDHSSHAIEYYGLNAQFSGRKMITLSEVGSFPDPDRLEEDGAAWSWFMPWYGEHTTNSKHNSVELWTKTMNHDYVVTLDEMPYLKSYERQDPVVEPEPEPLPPTGILNPQLKKSSLIAYPTCLANHLNLRSKKSIEHVAIFNTLGVEVISKKVSGHEVIIPLSDLPRGMYFVQVNGLETARLFKK